MAEYDHHRSFDVDALIPRFSYHPHSSAVQLIFAIIVGLIAGGFLFLGYILLV